MNRYRCVIFDLDGTLVDSHRYTHAGFCAALVGLAHAPTEAELHAAFGPAERVILRRFVPESQLDVAYARLQRYYARHVHSLRLHPEMRPLLDACCAADILLGLFTGRALDSTRLILEAHELQRFFGAIAAGDTVPQPKPAPDGVHLILQAFGLAPHEALVVGDSALDVQAARAAGADGIFATWFTPAARAPGVLPTVSAPNELRDLLGLGASS